MNDDLFSDNEEEHEGYGGELTEPAFPPEDVFAFTELRSVRELAHWVSSGQIDMTPEFQRQFVWSDISQSLFIDSLTKQLPIPSMCIMLDVGTKKRTIVDGLQRMSTIDRFINVSDRNTAWKISGSIEIDERIRKKNAIQIRDESEILYNAIENEIISVTIIRADFSKPGAMEYVFLIFQRLNTGSQKLTNQEIRNAIYPGDFNRMLSEVVRSKRYVEFLNIDDSYFDKKYRMKEEELLLRVFAFSEDRYKNYTGSLVKFLNKFMEDNSTNSELSLHLRGLSGRMLDLFAKDNFKMDRSNSRILLEAVMIGVLNNLEVLEKLDHPNFDERLKKLQNSNSFSKDEAREGLSSKAKVKGRIEDAIRIFGDG